ncbi:MAG: hypothetical protein CL916_03260 [Deltaproteobacteria bacterium]|nr:hypothetical protein [Deltaproteobacteria bacterium]
MEPPLLIEQGDTITPNPNLSSFVHPFSFTKNTNRKRVFCFGGSTTLGVPFEKDQKITFPGQLEKFLSASGEEVEVINLGGASFGSDHVLALGLEALQYEPDFFVIYSGNNEFFNHIINLEQSNQNWTYQPQPTFHLLAYFQMFLFSKTAREIQQTQQERWNTLLQAHIQNSEDVDEINRRRNDSIQNAVITRYIRNLRELNKSAHNKNVPIIFVVVPSNLYTPPAISIHSPTLSSTQKWEAELSLIDIENPSCQIKLDILTKQNPWHAYAWYQKARCAQNHNEPHQQDRVAALNLDMLPGRPNQIMNEHLLKSEFPLFLFEPKPEDFHDSCHLSQSGYQTLAKGISAEIVSQWNFSQQKILQSP